MSTRILTVSGSLRAQSSNTILLQAAAALAPIGVELSLYEGLGDLPHFNPDLDNDSVSQAVKDWRNQLFASHGVIFSVPEYAHGLPGSLKNALDWVVGSGELVEKPVTLFNASPRGTYAQAALTETLSVMSAKVIPATTLQPTGQLVSAQQIIDDQDMSSTLRAAVESFALAIQAVKAVCWSVEINPHDNEGRSCRHTLLRRDTRR